MDSGWLAVDEVVADQIIFGAGLGVDDAELLQDAISDGSGRGVGLVHFRGEVRDGEGEVVLHLHDELSAHSTGA